MLLLQSLFFIPLLLSTLIALSASSPIYMWASLEVNTIVFIPIMILNSKPESVRSAMKYFFIQAFASLIFLISTIMGTLSYILIMVAMMMKLGMSPLHNWFPSVMSNLSWIAAFLLSTWQKVAPLWIMLENMYILSIIPFLASLNALVGGIGGLAQTEIRPLIAFSSIGHMGWLIYSVNMSNFITVLYFFSYFIHLIFIMSMFSYMNMFSPKDMSSTTFLPNTVKLMIPIILLSLGGLPPLLGFIPKFMIINMSTMSFMVPMILIIGSYINIYYYMNLMWGAYMTNNEVLTFSHRVKPILLISSFISMFIMFMIYGLIMHF